MAQAENMMEIRLCNTQNKLFYLHNSLIKMEVEQSSKEKKIPGKII